MVRQFRKAFQIEFGNYVTEAVTEKMASETTKLHMEAIPKLLPNPQLPQLSKIVQNRPVPKANCWLGTFFFLNVMSCTEMHNSFELICTIHLTIIVYSRRAYEIHIVLRQAHPIETNVLLFHIVWHIPLNTKRLTIADQLYTI